MTPSLTVRYPYSKGNLHMEIISSKITGKGQITIPKKVRERLGLKEGNTLVFEVRANEAVIRKLPTIDPEWAKSLRPTLNEWEDTLDDEL